jgi:hypothetical protein
MATTIRARIYARGEVSFAKFLFLLSWFAKLLETNFSCFAKITWMPSFCQTVGVALRECLVLSQHYPTNCWRATPRQSILIFAAYQILARKNK